MPSVVRSVEIQAPPSQVWRWMASEEALRLWLSPNLEIDLRVGGAYRLLGPDQDTWVSGIVLDLVPEGGLVLSWFEEDSGWEHPARLVITLEPSAAGTRVQLVHDGFAGIGKNWPKTLDAYEAGADRHPVLDQLANLMVAGSA